MNNIEWKSGAVCYANGSQWIAPLNDGMIEDSLIYTDFQLNEIRTGDYVEASELDTEQKYNDVVEVFGLFGFEFGESTALDYRSLGRDDLSCCEDGLWQTYKDYVGAKRKLTYAQIMAIGELKRLISAPKTTADLGADKPKTATDYLKECIEVQKQRGEQYDSSGTGERSFDAAAKAYNALTGGNLKGSDVCLLLTCVKAVRQYSNPERLHEDSLLDGVSYLSLWAEELNKELKTTN